MSPKNPTNLTATTQMVDYDSATLILLGLTGICYTLGETYEENNRYLSETFYHLYHQLDRVSELLREEEQPEQEAA